MAKTTKKASAKKATPTKATKSSPAPEARIAREVLPMPDLKHVGLTTYDAKDPNTKYPYHNVTASDGRTERHDRPDRRCRIRRLIGIRRTM